MESQFFVSAILAYISCAQGHESKPNRSGGWVWMKESTCGARECVSISQCPPLRTLLNKSLKTQQDIQTLRKVQCGFQKDIPQVCCPRECSTPDANLGYCMSLNSCPTLLNLLKRSPMSTENFDYVENSRCEGSDQNSVCCSTNLTSEPVKPTKYCEMTAATPDTRTECCGVESDGGNRIIGGNATGVDQYPWLTVIEYKKASTLRLLCGGALISGKYVLTAGHCVRGRVLRYGTPINVRLGEYDTANEGPDCIPADGGGEDCTDGTVTILIEKVIPHPEYDPDHSLRRNDIALLRLTTIAPYTEFIRPICLPTGDWTLNPPKNFKLFVAGWGAVNETTSSSTVKLHVGLPFRTLESCQPAYSVSKRNVALWSGQLCAGGEQGKDSCKGDSGGPLMYQNNKTWEMTGIVSFGPTPCGIEDIPGVYTNVFQYITWIRSHIKP